MKRSLLVLCVIVLMIAFVSCNSQNDTKSDDSKKIDESIETLEVESSETETEETESPTISEPELHDSCDMILSVGYDGDDYYELVANENEDYDGRKVEVGVIKNNSWLLKPTNDMPLIHSVYGDFLGHNSIYEINSSDEYKLIYVGNGCFYFVDAKNYSMNAIYNAKNNKIFAQYDSLWNPQYIALAKISDFSPVEIYFDTLKPLTSEYSNVMVRWYGSDNNSVKVEVLDTNTMNTSTVVIDESEQDFEIHYIYPISEGLFAAVGINNPIAFYNMDGKKAFDTSDLHLLSTSNQNIIFENGECEIEIVNNAGTPYSITINTRGEVVSSCPL